MAKLITLAQAEQAKESVLDRLGRVSVTPIAVDFAFSEDEGYYLAVYYSSNDDYLLGSLPPRLYGVKLAHSILDNYVPRTRHRQPE